MNLICMGGMTHQKEFQDVNMEVLIPNIKQIPDWDWMITNFSVSPLFEECELLIQNNIWITARRIEIPVRSMSSNHIQNCIGCLEGKGKMKIPDGYLGGKDKWLRIFQDELNSRN